MQQGGNGQDAFHHSEYRALFALYGCAWSLAIPFLGKNRRLADGYAERALKTDVHSRRDLWIQAASGGEAYLAWTLLKHIKSAEPLRILLTSGTRQGMDVLEQAAGDKALESETISLTTAYFPFDKPSIMRSAVRRISPRLMVLLEAELWPGLLLALKQEGCRTWILNGRLTASSLSKYRMLSGLCRYLRPGKILAISPDDADRFRTLFDGSDVGVMPNIKFDRVSVNGGATPAANPLTGLIDPSCPFAALGSIRQPEETDVLQMVADLLARTPEAVVGLFPRHLHRVERWRRLLAERGIPLTLRSGLREPAKGGRVILWDVFGELSPAYERASAAFVGGSLAPLGGQNFLEPLFAGVIPVIGPSWENFAWIGPEIVRRQLVKVAGNWKEASSLLTAGLAHPDDREDIRRKARQFLADRQGGSALAAGLIVDALKKT